jgi:hypothetical protein
VKRNSNQAAPTQPTARGDAVPYRSDPDDHHDQQHGRVRVDQLARNGTRIAAAATGAASAARIAMRSVVR